MALVDGEPLPPTTPMTEDEIVQRLTEKARAGSVSALRAMMSHEQQRDPRERSAQILRDLIEQGRQQ